MSEQADHAAALAAAAAWIRDHVCQSSPVGEPEPRWLTVDQTAARYPIGRTTIYGLLERGEIESFLIGGRRVIVAESVDALFERLRSPGH